MIFIEQVNDKYEAHKEVKRETAEVEEKLTGGDFRKKIYEERSNYWIVSSLKERVGVFHELNDMFKKLVNLYLNSSSERRRMHKTHGSLTSAKISSHLSAKRQLERSTGLGARNSKN